MNRLHGQTSPYLLQHADNPVAWHPWDATALQLARTTNKPILLSIGYSACHWCHVMAHESFEDQTTADLMNEHFINIKVDREERPDLDRIYQMAHQILTRNRGGWPLTMFLDPVDHLPFFGGTYFPLEPRHGLPGFKQLLRGIAAAYVDKRGQIDDLKVQLRETLSQQLSSKGQGEINPVLVEQACNQLSASFDETLGGFGDAPKFPQSSGLELLLDAAACTTDAETAERLAFMADFTLSAMSCGGLYDHLQGGFFRYSVDARWTIPHFEKMLYDNGPLLALYTRRAWQLEAPWFTDVAHKTADWLLGVMQLDGGGLCSSLDADVAGVEGGSYVWSDVEVEAELGEDYAAFAARYGLAGPPNFEHQWHLRLPPPGEILLRPDSNPAAQFKAARVQLLARRAQREQPARDDKVLTAWNALSIKALAGIGRDLDRTDCVAAAMRCVDYLHLTHWRDGRLLATSRNGQAQLTAYLDDYAFLTEALLSLLSARWRNADLEFALALAEVMLDQFEDRENGGFYFTAADHETLLERPKTFSDESLPSGNGVAARALLELGHLIGEMRYIVAAERCLRASMIEAERWPHAHATMLCAVLDDALPPPRLLMRCDDPRMARDWVADAAQALGHRLRAYVLPCAATAPGLLGERQRKGQARVTAWLCSGPQCSLPVTDLNEFRVLLKETAANNAARLPV